MAEGVYEVLLEDTIIEDNSDVLVEPAPISIEVIEDDPRKISMRCECGQSAVYKFSAAKRILGLCSSSECMKRALSHLERWNTAAKSRSLNLLENDILEGSPKPTRKTARREIRDYQRSVGLPEDGILSPVTKESLRRAGRSGMISVWEVRLREEKSIMGDFLPV